MARNGLRSHLTGSVPISIAAHLVVILLLLIVPLAADISLPVPERDFPEFMRVAPTPPLPPSAPTPARRPSPSEQSNPGLAPTVAPRTIEAEHPAAPPQFDVPVGTGTGLPAMIGDPTGIVASVPAPPPAEPPHPTTVRVAQLPEPPRKIVDARPVYPDIALKARVEGTVTLEAVLDTSGNVTQLHVVRSIPLLDQAALDAVRRWKYSPTMYGGRPVSVLMTITIRFTLNQ